MLSGSESSFSESEIELSELNSSSGQQDNEDSDGSSTSETVTHDQSLLSCSSSEMSIHTGSTAYIVLPPRPVPPLPPPPQSSRTFLDWCNGDMDSRPPTRRSRSRSANPARKPRNAFNPQVVMNKTLPAKKRLSKTLSSETMTISPPCDQISRTFSSEAIRRLLFSLPPSYPPPLPPDFPLPEDAPRSLRLPMLPRKPTLPPPLPPLVPSLPQPQPQPPPPPPPYHPQPPTVPPLPLSQRSLPRPPLPERVHSSTKDSSYESASSHSRRGGRCLFKRRSLILITLFSLALSLASCLFATFGFINFVLPIWTTQPICIQSKSLLPELQTTLEKCNGFKDTNEEGKFCVRYNRDISNLILCMVDAMKKVHHVKKPEIKYMSAHKYLQQDAGKRKLIFSQPNDLEHLHGMGAIKDNTLQINQTGLYFVYSSIYFTHKCEHEKESSHFIIQKTSKEGFVLLAEGSHKCTSQGDKHTSYTGGIFRLSENDEIFVNVSDPGTVSSTKSSNYLGLMLINMP